MERAPLPHALPAPRFFTFCLALWVLLPLCARADITVMNNNDMGAGSLRQAIADLTAGQTIFFDAGLDGMTINLASSLAISKDMTIDATNIDLTVTLADIVFDVSLASVTLRGLNIVNLPGAFAAVRCLNGTLTIETSTLDGADRGIVFVSTNSLTVDNSTVQGANRGIAMGDGAVTVNNSTIIGGTQDAIESGGFGVTARNSTLVGVTNGTSTINGTTLYSSIVIPTVNGPLIDLGFNLIVANNAAAGIAAALADNGGPTPTFAVLPASPALDAGDCAASVYPNHDQRFFGQTNSGPRAVDGDAVPGALCDVGAVEFMGVPLPVELTAFEGYVNGTTATLRWQTATETHNAGFELHMQRTVPGAAWQTVAFIDGAGTTTEAQHYRYDVDNLTPGRHRFRLKQIDFDGTFTYSAELELAVRAPGAFRLSPAYPNPLPPGREAAHLTLDVAVDQHVQVGLYDLLGRHLKVIFHGGLRAHHAHRFMVPVGTLPSGTYVIRADGEGFSQQHLLIVQQ